MGGDAYQLRYIESPVWRTVDSHPLGQVLIMASRVRATTLAPDGRAPMEAGYLFRHIAEGDYQEPSTDNRTE